MVWPCASTRGTTAATTATATPSASAMRMRADFIDTPSSGGEKVGCRVSRAPREDEPLAAQAAAGGTQRRLGALEPERRREAAAELGARHREGRAGVHGAQRKEAGEEPAARPDDGRHRADVVAAAGGIDRAVARVLPDAVEGVGGLASEREDVALLEFDLHAVAPGQGAGRGDRGRREV